MAPPAQCCLTGGLVWLEGNQKRLLSCYQAARLLQGKLRHMMQLQMGSLCLP
jgi:hypothetical protein